MNSVANDEAYNVVQPEKQSSDYQPQEIEEEVNTYLVKCLYSTLTENQYTVHKIIPCNDAWRVRLVDQQLHVTMTKHLKTYNTGGDVVECIRYQHCEEPDVTSSIPLKDNGYIIADNNQGLYHINNKGEVVSKVCPGCVCDIYEYKNKMYVYDFITANVHVFMKIDNILRRVHQIHLSGYNNQCCFDRIVVCDDFIYISSMNNHCVYQFNHTGQQLCKYGQYGADDRETNGGLLYWPLLCDIDLNGSLLIADHFNHRLQILNSDREWVVISLPQEVEWPKDAIVYMSDHSLWILADNGLYKLSKSKTL